MQNCVLAKIQLSETASRQITHTGLVACCTHMHMHTGNQFSGRRGSPLKHACEGTEPQACSPFFLFLSKLPLLAGPEFHSSINAILPHVHCSLPIKHLLFAASYKFIKIMIKFYHPRALDIAPIPFGYQRPVRKCAQQGIQKRLTMTTLFRAFRIIKGLWVLDMKLSCTIFDVKCDAPQLQFPTKFNSNHWHEMRHLYCPQCYLISYIKMYLALTSKFYAVQDIEKAVRGGT